MSLTKAGEQLFAMVQRMLTMEAEAEFFLRDSGKLNQGALRLSAVGPFHVIEMVSAYRKQYPSMKLSIRMGNSQQVLSDIERYTTDIGVLAGLHNSDHLEAVLYAHHPIILFAHREHPLSRYDQVPLASLAGMELLRREEGSTTQATLDAALAEAKVQTKCALEVGSREMLREAVARGLGIGAVSEAEFIPDPRFKSIRITGEPAATKTYIYYSRERRDSLLIQSFLTAIENRNHPLR